MKVAVICKKSKQTEIVLMRYVQTNESMMCQTTRNSTRTLSAMLRAYAKLYTYLTNDKYYDDAQSYIIFACSDGTC